jgi:hypothetical protein
MDIGANSKKFKNVTLSDSHSKLEAFSKKTSMLENVGGKEPRVANSFASFEILRKVGR